MSASRSKALFWLLISALLWGCSPGYVIKAAFEEGKILANRREIDAVLDDQSASNEERAKLSLVRSAREYARSIGLTPGDSFTTYSRVDRDPLTWVLAGSRPDTFSLHTWWFPIVGEVPYKGFFEESDARAAARALEKKGFEISLRGADAFSTLGWFNDPVLSTTLKHPETRVVDTVIHEIVHSTIWIPGNVPFNESLANFVGGRAAVQFFELMRDSCMREQAPCADTMARLAFQSTQSLAAELEAAEAIFALYRELDQMYQRSDLSREQKLKLREEIFAHKITPLRTKYPKMTVLKSINNAEIVQLVIYMHELPLFALYFEHCGGSWERFFEGMREIKKTLQSSPSADPFELLRAHTGASLPRSPMAKNKTNWSTP